MSQQLPRGAVRGKVDGKMMVAVPERQFWELKARASSASAQASRIRVRLGLSCREKCKATDPSCECDKAIRRALA